MPRAPRMTDRAAGVALSLAFIACSTLALVECAALLLRPQAGSLGDEPLVLVLAIVAPLLMRCLRFRRFPSLAENAIACSAFLVVLFAFASQPESAFPGYEADYRRMVFGVGGAIATYFVILGYRFMQRRRA